MIAKRWMGGEQSVREKWSYINPAARSSGSCGRVGGGWADLRE